MKQSSNYAWRMKSLDQNNAGTGLFQGCICDFVIPDYYTYGYFNSQESCELPGKLFRAKSSGAPGSEHVYFAPGFAGEPFYYDINSGPETLYAAWRVKAPDEGLSGGRFSYIAPIPAPWRLWCNSDEKGMFFWWIETLQGGSWVREQIPDSLPDDGWLNPQVAMETGKITFHYGEGDQVTLDHDPYKDRFIMTYGSSQTEAGGREVISEYAEVYFRDVAYPFDPLSLADGPEDIRQEDNAFFYMVSEATPEEPRHSEGDLIELKDGGLLLVWTNYYEGKGWDRSPAYLSAKISRDGGATWGEKRTLVEDENDENVMSASMLRAGNGDILFAYKDKTPGMKAAGMVIRRSADEGNSWGESVRITPNNGNRHLANNNCLRMLEGGRIILSCREYIDGIRWSYCLYSDDDGYSWKAGKHMPDPGLSQKQKEEQNLNEPRAVQLSDGRLLMTKRSVAGGQFFSYSDDGGETWSIPYLSPLRGVCSPAVIEHIPGSDDLLAIWNYGLTSRTPLNSAITHDDGKSWKHLKLVERSHYHGYCYTSISFIQDMVYLTYMHYPEVESIKRFEVEPGYIDLRLTVLPVKWFYRDVVI